jgi:hypothetical protein
LRLISIVKGRLTARLLIGCSVKPKRGMEGFVGIDSLILKWDFLVQR